MLQMSFLAAFLKSFVFLIHRFAAIFFKILFGVDIYGDLDWIFDRLKLEQTDMLLSLWVSSVELIQQFTEVFVDIILSVLSRNMIHHDDEVIYKRLLIESEVSIDFNE